MQRQLLWAVQHTSRCDRSYLSSSIDTKFLWPWGFRFTPQPSRRFLMTAEQPSKRQKMSPQVRHIISRVLPSLIPEVRSSVLTTARSIAMKLWLYTCSAEQRLMLKLVRISFNPILLNSDSMHSARPETHQRPCYPGYLRHRR